MRNKNYIVLAVGIGLFGVFAIFIALASMVANNPEIAVDTVYGSLRLPEAISRFEADGVNGLVTIEPGEEAKRLPAGQYRIRFWKTERKDDGGNTWALAGHYFGQDNPFEIKDGDETRLDVGEPIIATVEARNVGSSYSFNQVIKGRHDEIIELTRNGSRPQPPKLNIKNKDGSYAQTFNFQYG
ncbi:MAG TPA: hypothetical protein VMX36_09990 [Sedimentisphaerales bacterium]|nr:hypothetical protein [Sedimentisphaerales bacterium]